MSKFAPLPKHPFDLGAQRLFAAKLNALLNARVVDTTGAPAGEVKYADGNTTFILAPAGNVIVKKYDPAKTCAKGYLYKVRATDAAVTTGVLIGAAYVKATPGKYVALRAVPVPTLAAHIPQLPDPISTDPEASGKFWEWISPASACVDGVTVEV